MDQCMLDVTDIGRVKVGDTVTLFGDGSDGGPTVEEVAGWLGTIVDEVTCGVGKRVPRVYLKGGEVTGARDCLNLA